MKEKKVKVKKSAEALRTADVVAAYRLLTTAKTADKDGLKLTALETKDIFKILRAINAMKPTATAYEDFLKDVQERLKPEDWDSVVEKAQKFADLSEDEKREVNAKINTYNLRISECVSTEAEKKVTLPDYERIGDDALGLLVKDNGHLFTDAPSVLLVMQLLGGGKN